MRLYATILLINTGTGTELVANGEASHVNKMLHGYMYPSLAKHMCLNPGKGLASGERWSLIIIDNLDENTYYDAIEVASCCCVMLLRHQMRHGIF